MKSDIVGLIVNKLRIYRIRLFQVFVSLAMRPIFKLKGIHLKKGSKLFGVPIIVRSPYSTISLGKNLTMRSDKSSNLIGIFKPCTLSTLGRNNAKLEIGDNCGLSGASITAFNHISLGNHVLVGANTIITDSDWHSLNPNNRNYNVENSPVFIHDNVWLGANSIVLKGVIIGENTVIGAGSVVVKSIPSNVIAAGNPCKVIREL